MRQSTLMRLMQPEDLFFNFGYPMDAERKSETKSYFFETDEAYMTSLDIPGVPAEEIQIEFEEGKLFVNAERKIGPEKNQQIKKYSYEFFLPKNIDRDKIEAHAENGVLTLAVRKLEVEKTKKKIPVSTGAKSGGWSSFLSFGKNPAKTEDDMTAVN